MVKRGRAVDLTGGESGVYLEGLSRRIPAFLGFGWRLAAGSNTLGKWGLTGLGAVVSCGARFGGVRLAWRLARWFGRLCRPIAL